MVRPRARMTLRSAMCRPSRYGATRSSQSSDRASSSRIRAPGAGHDTATGGALAHASAPHTRRQRFEARRVAARGYAQHEPLDGALVQSASCWWKDSSDGSGTYLALRGPHARSLHRDVAARERQLGLRRAPVVRGPIAPTIRAVSARSTSPRTSNPRLTTHDVSVSRARTMAPVTSGSSNWSTRSARARFFPCVTACFGGLLRRAAPCP